MMKRNFGVAALLGLVAVIAPAIKAYAGPACTVLGTCSPNPCPILIQNDADNCKAYESSYNRTGFNSAPGSQLTIVGKIVSFNPPLADLVPSCPTKEYTFVISGLVSKGTLVALNGPTTVYTAAYDTTLSNPVFAIYEGTPCNTPNTFADWTADQPNGAVE